jgi:hypothetical protein
MREKQVRSAGRAQADVGDPVRVDPGRLQDGAVHAGEVEPPAGRPGRHRVGFPGGQGTRHGLRHRCIHLVAAPADAGADGRPAVTGVRAVGGCHGLEGTCRDPPRRAPPASVHGRCGPLHRVVDQDREAVGRRDHQGQIGEVRHQRIVRVALVQEEVRESLAGHQRLAHGQHAISVHLLDPDHLRGLEIKGPKEPAPVLLDGFGIVSDAHPQVERGVGHPAHAALPRAEGMHHPVRIPEDGGLDQDWWTGGLVDWWTGHAKDAFHFTTRSGRIPRAR